MDEVTRPRAHWTRYRYFKTLLVLVLLALLAVALIFTQGKLFGLEDALMMSGIAVPDDIGDSTMLPILGRSLPRRADGVSVSFTVGRTGPVMHQKQCSSCWAFALASMLADRHAIYNGRDPEYEPQLSPQSLLDVATPPSNRISQCYAQSRNKCQCGESPFYAASLTVDHGMLAEACVDYRAGMVSAQQKHDEGQCFDADDEHRNCFYLDSYKYKSCEDEDGNPLFLKFKSVYVTTSESKALEELRNNGPIVCIVGVTPDLGSYTSGVIEKRENEESLVKSWHAVCIVGYGEDSSSEGYWIIKNSWGEDWGEAGFFRTRYGKNVLCMTSVFPLFCGFFD